MQLILGAFLVASCGANQEIPGTQFAEGFVNGFFGNKSGISECLDGVKDISKDFGSLVSDLKSHNITKFIGDLKEVLTDSQHALYKCKEAGKNLKPILDALKEIHSAKDFLEHMKADILEWDAKMLDELEHAVKVCTFQDPDAKECGRLIGKGTRQLVIGDNPASIALTRTQSKTDFAKGFLEGLCNHTKDISKCIAGTHGIAGDVQKTMQDLKAHKFEAAIEDIEKVFSDTSSAVKDCKSAAKDLEPFLHILDGVHSKGDLYKKIKKNALDNDVEVMDRLEDMFSRCTFKNPNAEKCGKDMGTIARLFAIGSGDNTEVVV